MNTGHAEQPGGPGDNNVATPPESTSYLDERGRVLRDNGWLHGFRVDSMDGPVLTRQVASYVDNAAPMFEETNDVLTEVVMTHNKRQTNHVHRGWSVDAIATVSPWTLSRIDGANRHHPVGTWITRRTLAQKLKVRTLPEDLAPVPEFEAAIEEALGLPTRFEKFQAVYRALSRWGDVVPLEFEMGSSLSLTDTEGNFAQLPLTTNSLSQLSAIKTADLIRKGPVSNAGWDDGTWATMDVPAVEWRVIRMIAVVPTLNLLPADVQNRLADLYDELLAYVPPLTVDLIHTDCNLHDDTIHASKTISRVALRCRHHICALSVGYLDGTGSGSGGDGGDYQAFPLTSGEHIVEMLTWTDGEWLRAMQFVTNKGRCSAIYGWVEGTPTISRSDGGVLAGFSMRTKKHSEWGYMLTGVNGIWRHDLIPRVPKESDVYSDFCGPNPKHGIGFNDRALIGNSNSMYISSVEVRAHGDIHSVEFTYTDTRDGKIRKLKSPRHGGSHGPYFRFDLEKGEHIVSVTGSYSGDWLRQLCFGTNLGRTSDVYGMGGGQSFSARAPLGENGRSMRLQYIIGRCKEGLVGAMFVWTPDLS